MISRLSWVWGWAWCIAACRPALDNIVLLPSFTRMDAAMFIRLNKVLRVQANIENLANIDYVASANNNNNISPGAPRIFRLTLVANF